MSKMDGGHWWFFFRSKVMQQDFPGQRAPQTTVGHTYSLSSMCSVYREALCMCVCGGVGGASYHRTRGHLCHGFKMLKQGPRWARAVLASGLLVPK